MPFGLLDGSSGHFDFTTGTTPAVSWKTVSSYFSFDLGRRMEDRTTFGTTGGWASGVPTMKQAAIRLDGFASQGLAISDPLAIFSTTVPSPFVATIETGCTLSGNLHAVGEHIGERAQAASEMGFSAVTDGAVSSTWVTS
jgi:hypothetical protein